MKHFKEKVVVITGASSGIGAASALAFANKGAHVVLAARRKDKLQNIKEQIEKTGVKALAHAVDVAHEAECQNLIYKTIDTFGKIDILVNNAGISMRAKFEDTHLSVLKELFDVNFWGTVYCTKYALPHILEQRGSIVGVSSIAGFAPLPGRTGYAASKHAMNGFLSTVRVENIQNKLHVLVIHPGFTATEIRFTARDKDGKLQSESPRNESKMMTSEEVAQYMLKAVCKRKNNLILTRQGRLLSILYKFFPKFTEKLIFNEMRKEADAPFAQQ